MAHIDVIQQIGRKGADAAEIAERVIAEPGRIAGLVTALTTEKSAARYGYEKVLRRVSEHRPDLLYPHFDVFARMLDCDNNFFRWGAIMTVANLTVADAQRKFEALFDKYYAPIAGPTMITAANIIGSSPRIARAKPHLAGAIVCEILKVRTARYKHRGRPSPECRNVAIGHAIDAFDMLFEQVDDKTTILAFVKKQLKNTRKPVAKRAERFLRKHKQS